jgi:N-methylhydantoinase A
MMASSAIRIGSPRIGVDIGGTFTDLVMSVDGRLRIHKLLSTPHDPSEAMLAGLRSLSPQLDGVSVAHGSTVATNAILERKGARTALITTQGFRDLLAIGRQNRPDLYALQPQLPPPLIPRQWCYEVPERLDFTGAALTPLDMAALDAVLDALAAEQIESVAVCFLYSYVNPAHEQAVRARILERGLLTEAQIALSSDVLPEFREYERASTTALEAYVRPVMSRYLGRLEDQLPDRASLRVMKSDGGIISARRARQQAIQTALSGPAAGVIGAFHLAQLAGYDQIITLDIGGTSTDVALCPGALVRRPESEIDRLPLRIRLLDIETVGAGGGSIARLDAGGALRVGPESAGADPGPIVYGRGGQQVTVSDANAVLGRLDAAHFLGGTMTLDMISAQAAVAELGRQMNLTSAEAAQGIIQVANTNIDRAIRRVSIARGHDPRHFTLFAFGGAGPLHACEVAERLQIPRVLIPPTPGVLCAFGLLVADVAMDYSRSILGQPEEALKSVLAELFAQAYADLEAEGIPEEKMIFTPTLDARYQGQAYELTIPFPVDNDLLGANRRFAPTTAPIESAALLFHAVHQQTYGYALAGRGVELVNLRLQAVGVVEKPLLEGQTLHPHHAVPTDMRSGWALYERSALSPGAQFDGPALVFQMDSTIYVAPGWLAQADGYWNLILTRESAQDA